MKKIITIIGIMAFALLPLSLSAQNPVVNHSHQSAGGIPRNDIGPRVSYNQETGMLLIELNVCSSSQKSVAKVTVVDLQSGDEAFHSVESIPSKCYVVLYHSVFIIRVLLSTGEVFEWLIDTSYTQG